MAGGGEELIVSKEDLEEDVAHPQQGGGGAAGVRIIFQGCGAGGTVIQIGDLGGQPLHGKGPGGVSDPGGGTTDGTAPAEDTGREVEIHLGGDGRGGRGVLDYALIHQAAP